MTSLPSAGIGASYEPILLAFLLASLLRLLAYLGWVLMLRVRSVRAAQVLAVAAGFAGYRFLPS